METSEVVTDVDDSGDDFQMVQTPYRIPTTLQTPVRSPQGIVISGEAPESDDEIYLENSSSSSFASGIQGIVANERLHRSSSHESAGKGSGIGVLVEDRLKYNTKLRERNTSLRKNLITMACQPYQTATKEISSITQQLIKSQQLVQELSTTLRRLTNEIFQLEDKVDTIRSCSLLPELSISATPVQEV